MRTLVVSDLHLGSPGRRDVLRRPGPLAALTAAVRDADRLVLLGDTIELRQGPERDALAAAAPVLAALGEALGPDGELVLVPGNHDHTLLAPWAAARRAHAAPPPLGLEERIAPGASPALGALADAVAPARLSVAYPGLWLRPDVYATHGHQLDAFMTVPTFERLAVGLMRRVLAPVPTTGATPDDLERVLAPLYAWMREVAEAQAPGRRGGGSASAAGWAALTRRGGGLRARAIRGGFRTAVLALNAMGAGPLHAHLSGNELRRAGLAALGQVVQALGVDARHVVFGHTHRAGPLPHDELAEWHAPTGAALHNAGCWVDEATFTRGDAESPYWAGRALVLEDDGPPRLVRLVTDLR